MPMSREERIEKVQRLLTAHKATKKTLESEPVTWELHPGTDIARNWTVITAAYSGLEQTLKYLLAEEANMTIAALIDLAVPREAEVSERHARKYPYRTHNLAWLFSRLGQPTQDVVRDFYGRFQSLHSYVGVHGAGEFLNRISGPRGAGYERWRYTLIEDRPLPRNSPETLSALWGVCVQIAEQQLWSKQRVRMPDAELAQQFCQHLDMIVAKLSIDRQEAGEPFQDIAGEIRKWLWAAGHPLNAFAGALWHFARYGSHGAEHTSDWFSEALTRWLHDVLARPAASARTSLRAFINRARGHSPDGASIRWDPDRKRFETIPWSLEARVRNTVPPRATLIADPDLPGTSLRSLWLAARDSGYRVLENRSVHQRADREIWSRTLRVYADAAAQTSPVLSIWRKPDDEPDRFYLLEECAPRDLSEPVRRWTAMARTLGDLRNC